MDFFADLKIICQMEARLRFLHKRLQLGLDLKIRNMVNGHGTWVSDHLHIMLNPPVYHTFLCDLPFPRTLVRKIGQTGFYSDSEDKTYLQKKILQKYYYHYYKYIISYA